MVCVGGSWELLYSEEELVVYCCRELTGPIIQRRVVGFSIVFELIERIMKEGRKR